MTTELTKELKQANSRITIRSPRKPWLEFLLHFFTFGVYTCFWMVARVREFNQIHEKKFTPWLWFFVPHFGLVQLFALPSFNETREAIETNLKLPSWKDKQGLWFAGIVLMTFGASISAKISISEWLYLLLLLFWALLFTWVQYPINRIKEKLENIDFRGKRKGYSVWEWIGLLLGSFLMILIIYAGILEPLMVKSLQTLEQDSVYEEQQHGFKLPIVGEGWSKVEIGTHSDGSAILELRGPISSMSFIIFQHHRDETLDSIMQWRMMELKKEIGSNDCKQTRTFAKSRLSINAYAICSGSVLFLPITYTISLIETDSGVYEMLGEIHDEKKFQNRYMTTLETMAKGFEPL